LNPRIYGYRGPGAAYDRENRGWSSGDREGLNYLIGHHLPDYWGYYVLGPWGTSGQIYGDVAVDQLGYVWTGSALGILMRFDPNFHQTTTFQLGSEIKGMAIDRYGYIWVALGSANIMMKFDSEGNQIGNPVAVGITPMGFGDMTGYEFGRRMTAVDDPVPTPGATSMLAAYPNPFNAATKISYSIAEPGRVSLSIYNLLGQRITTIEDGHREAGDHAVIWNAFGLPSGLYFARLESGNNADNLKISLVK
jgi:hypothetical protein